MEAHGRIGLHVASMGAWVTGRRPAGDLPTAEGGVTMSIRAALSSSEQLYQLSLWGMDWAMIILK